MSKLDDAEEHGAHKTVRERVFAESRRFRAALPTLIPIYGGKWVVFRDGEVQSVHHDADAALVAGVDRFGPEGAMVIAEVREPEVIRLRETDFFF